MPPNSYKYKIYCLYNDLSSVPLFEVACNCLEEARIGFMLLIFMCFVFICEQTSTCATYSINWLVFITAIKSVYCAVVTGPLNKAGCASSVKRLKLGLQFSDSKRIFSVFLQFVLRQFRLARCCFRFTHDDGSWWHVACARSTQHNRSTPVINGWLAQRQRACVKACEAWEPARDRPFV